MDLVIRGVILMAGMVLIMGLILPITTVMGLCLRSWSCRSGISGMIMISRSRMSGMTRLFPGRSAGIKSISSRRTGKMPLYRPDMTTFIIRGGTITTRIMGISRGMAIRTSRTNRTSREVKVSAFRAKARANFLEEVVLEEVKVVAVKAELRIFKLAICQTSKGRVVLAVVAEA